MTDLKLEQIVGNLLRAGVALAASIVMAGGIWYLAAQGGTREEYHVFHRHREAMPWTHGLSAPLVTIQIGLLILIATPVARVVFSMVAFALEGDTVYVGITAIVLAILAYSLAGG